MIYIILVSSWGPKHMSPQSQKLLVWTFGPHNVRYSYTHTHTRQKHFIIQTWASYIYNTIQINLRLALFVTYTIIQSITSSEMCFLHLTHPSAHTTGAVGSRHCGARGAVGGSVPCSRVSPQSWTLPARARIQTHNLGLPQVSSPTLYPLGHDCPLLLIIWVCFLDSM